MNQDRQGTEPPEPDRNDRIEEGRENEVPVSLPASDIDSSIDDAVQEILSHPEILRDPSHLRSIFAEFTSVTRRFEGRLPFPPAEILGEYDARVPNTSERIIEDFFEEGKHRRSLERDSFDLSKHLVSEENKRLNKSIWMAFIIAILFGLGSLWLGLEGRTVASVALGGGTLVAIVIGFISLGNPDALRAIGRGKSSDEDR